MKTKWAYWFCLVLHGCISKSEPELFLIPNNYEGVIIVLFNQEKGQTKRYFENRRLYDIPENGVLLTEFPKTTHGKLDQKYYYKDVSGNKTIEIKNYILQQGGENENYVMNGVYGQVSNELDSANKSKYPIAYKAFTIGKINNKDSLQQVLENALQKFICCPVLEEPVRK